MKEIPEQPKNAAELINDINKILETPVQPETVANVSQEKKLENLKEIEEPKGNNWGGKRPGSGIKKGQKTKKTMEQKIALEYIKNRVLRSLPKIMSSQMNLAKGCQYLFKIETKIINGKEVKQPPKIVKDKEEILAYLAGDYDDEKDTYYFLTTEKPDVRALDSLLDRVFGKATQNFKGEMALTMADFLKKLDE